MKILISGAFGFIGGHLLELLLQELDNVVYAVDSGASCPVPPIQLIHDFENSHNLKYFPTTIQNYINSSPEPVDVVYHLASVVGPVGVLEHSGKIAQGVIADAMVVADFCRKIGARLVDVSTSECFGGGQEGLCSEKMECRIGTEPSARLEYAVGKLVAEVALRNLARDRDLDVRIVRPFNVTGPRQSPRGGFVLPRFVVQALAGKPLTVYGDGSQRRAFTHVKDIALGLVLAAESGVSGEVYNLGNPDNQCSIRSLAESVLYELDRPVDVGISYVDPKTLFGERFHEANDKFPDATKAMTELGWQPVANRFQIVRDVVDYWKTVKEDRPSYFAQIARTV